MLFVVKQQLVLGLYRLLWCHGAVQALCWGCDQPVPQYWEEPCVLQPFPLVWIALLTWFCKARTFFFKAGCCQRLLHLIFLLPVFCLRWEGILFVQSLWGLTSSKMPEREVTHDQGGGRHGSVVCAWCRVLHESSPVFPIHAVCLYVGLPVSGSSPSPLSSPFTQLDASCLRSSLLEDLTQTSCYRFLWYWLCFSGLGK